MQDLKIEQLLIGNLGFNIFELNQNKARPGLTPEQIHH